MKPTELRHRIHLDELDDTAQNEYGEPIETWTEVARPYARVDEPSGWEAFKSGQILDATITRFTIRYRTFDRPDAKHRVRYAGHTYNVQAVREPDGRRKWLILDCVR